jgi:glycosyltransferase involved in cell wall biosynthesis
MTLPGTARVAILLPCYNEALTLGATVRNVR